MPKATDAEKAGFRALIASIATEMPAVEVKPMFGQLGAFVNGNMFAGLFGSAIGVKLDPTDAAELAKAGGGPFGPAERPMGGYVSLPAGADAGLWTARAAAHVSALPPKPQKKAPAKPKVP
ncbi:TfoX/Sxy family protein [Sinomonas atrocyanea]|uniref:TfoX/Sxy family protein n=1 Tax=Sinomonas atrocyanea TaxID=37927 RepID=UPI0027824BCA|nr:TfoX/Sxy family transcriptional regulator of competence genes [Sinomonas atrocyanea]MDR6622918.1 TfoX/Sxy family transcriptional regulator of competence genes [Sinomonas atrocyanea]